MIVELGPLRGHSVGVGDEVAVRDDAADVVVTPVPVVWPGYWSSSGHFFRLGFLGRGIVGMGEEVGLMVGGDVDLWEYALVCSVERMWMRSGDDGSRSME